MRWKDQALTYAAMTSDISGLAARWLRWAASSDESSSPITDASGAFAGSKQPTDVWFVAGNRGGVSSRSFDVNGVSLFGAKMHVAGHWAYVEPLAPGSHLLEIHGGDGHGWTTSVQAEITVC